ncbi:MAG: lipopolysaccharide biosynthesis protein [Alphaproteobacteria bacterium]|nr:lipopolysaccharide biosynthesis protein [Alphaproteobacteria bacterium]
MVAPREGAPNAAAMLADRFRVRLRQGFEWLDPTKQRALTALGIRVTGAAIAYFMQILLAQWMGLTEYGVFVGVWVWLLVLGGIAPLGLNVSVIGLLSTFHDAGTFDRWRGLIVSSVTMAMAASLVIAGIGWGIVHLEPDLFSPQYLMPVWLCLFCVPLMTLSEMNEGISRAHGWMNTSLLPTYILRPLLLIGGCLCLLWAGVDLTATTAMATAIAACLATVLLQGTVMLVRLRRLGGEGGYSATPWTWLLASLPIVVAQAFDLITQNFDLIAVSYFLGPEAAGVYFAALKTIALLAYVNFAVGAATANKVASLHASGDRDELASALGGAVNLAFWPTLAGAILLVLLAPYLLELFGREFVAHSHLTIVLAAGFLAKAFVGPAELYLNVLGQQKICALTLLLAAALNMVLNIALIPYMGLLGAAIATSVSLTVLAGSLHWIARRRLGVSLRPAMPVLSWRRCREQKLGAR